MHGLKDGVKKAWRAGVVAAALILCWVILALPNHLPALTERFWGFPPLELAPLIALLWLAPPRRSGGIAAWLTPALALTLSLLLLLKLADMMALQAYWRIFDPLADRHLLGPGFNVLEGALGPWRARLLGGGVLLGLALSFVLMWRGLRQLARVARPTPAGRLLAGAGLAVLVGALSAGLWGERPPLAASTRLVIEHVSQSRQNLRDLAELQQGARRDERRVIETDQLLNGLRDRDVLMVFVESYGRVLFSQPRYAKTLTPRLENMERSLEAEGFGSRSAWLESPTVGGQSWLSHATLQSGLWINSQRRYNWLMGSERRSLSQLFERAGWRTLAVQPALTRNWSDNAWYRFQKVYDARNLGYEGAPYNWVTMPDQYTLAALQARELARPGRAPVMAEVATISSHAPWTPIPPLIDWEAVGDGRIFSQWADAGDPPDVVWQDSERVRRQYLRSIDYVLETLAAFVARYGDDDLVMLVMGDHQPATLITGEGASRQVPVHIITRDNQVLEAFRQWRWSAGMRPLSDAPEWGMDELRPRLLERFSAPATR